MAESIHPPSEEQAKAPSLPRRLWRIATWVSGADTLRMLAKPVAKIVATSMEQNQKLQMAMWDATLDALKASHSLGQDRMRRMIHMSDRFGRSVRERVENAGGQPNGK